MRLLGLFLVALLVAGCDIVHREKIEDCHDRVHSRAKNQAEILQTNVRSAGFKTDSFESNKIIVEGRAKLQNGYGAWSNYHYYCEVIDSGLISKFKLEEGYKSF